MQHRVVHFTVALLLFGGQALTAAPQSAGSKKPQLISAFPLALRAGARCQVEVRGQQLADVSDVWFECGDLRGSVRCVQPLNVPGDEQPGANEDGYTQAASAATQRVLLDVSVAQNAASGLHGFRLITPRGMTNGLALHVVAEPTLLEDCAVSSQADRAQVLQIPVVVNGRMEQKGERDFYTIPAARGESLRFEVFCNFKPSVGYRAKVELALYDAAGSWFDASRLNRLNLRGPVISWEPMHPLARWFDRRMFPTEFVLFPRLVHQFEQAGQYKLAVSSFLGAGAADHFYVLRVTSASPPTVAGYRKFKFGRPAHPDPADWLERDSSTLRQWGSFRRQLSSNRLQLLATRGVPPDDDAHTLRSTKLTEQTEREPNQKLSQATKLCLPGFVEGKIESAGDIDWFTFQAEAGQQLVCEIETPRFAPPLFNPWLRIRDPQGKELIANIYKEYGGDGDDVNKNLERKTLFTCPESGTYSLEARDLSLRDGGPDFCYRVLIRPQVPHVGRLEVNLDVISEGSVLIDLADHINLVAGSCQEIVLVCEKEEGFDGSLAIGAEGLPEGVELLSSEPAAHTDVILTGFQYRPPGRDLMSATHHRAQRCPITVVLYARPDAPPTPTPSMVRLTARPIKAGRVGPALPAQRVALMVVSESR